MDMIVRKYTSYSGVILSAIALVLSPAVVFGEKTARTDSEIVVAIESLGDVLGERIAHLASTVSLLAPPSDDFSLRKIFIALFVVFIGAFSAYIFNFLHWKMVDKRNKLSKIGESLNILIKDLEVCAIEYWTKDYNELEQHQINVLEISLKSRLLLIPKYILILNAELAGLDRKKHTLTTNKLTEFGCQIFDLVTGGEFESKQRKASKSKAMRISSQCSNVRAKISSLDFSV